LRFFSLGYATRWTCSIDNGPAITHPPGCGYGTKIATELGVVPDLGFPDSEGVPEVNVVVEQDQYDAFMAAPCP
jgi:hypothetical protein